MEITVIKADLSNAETGGGFREVKAEITLDSSLPYRQQRNTLLYEALGSMLDYVISHEELLDISIALGDALDQLGSE
ncbi:hypothetical protein LCGC14_2180960 [marine sediment metagenome]|uniref:Uncharacterized protein n=1 Tax=marine sediment metagenome TaxID=412755 RepID=A0A0F9FZU2_9ZZZZ